MKGDFVGPRAAAPVMPVIPLEIRPIAAANTGVRNGMPEPKGYVYDPKGRRREEEIARILAGIRARIGAGNGGGEA